MVARRVNRGDYLHLESCYGELIGDYETPDAFVIDRIGDFFWNKDEPEDGRFSIRLHGDDIAWRAPRRLRDQFAAARFARYARDPRRWAIACRCGALTLTTTGVMRFWEEGGHFPAMVYVHFEPGFTTESPERSW